MPRSSVTSLEFIFMQFPLMVAFNDECYSTRIARRLIGA